MICYDLTLRATRLHLKSIATEYAFQKRKAERHQFHFSSHPTRGRHNSWRMIYWKVASTWCLLISTHQFPIAIFGSFPLPIHLKKQHLFVLLWLYRFDAQSHDVSSFHLPALVLLHSRPLHHYLIARRFAAQTWQSHKLNSAKVINPWPR